MSVFKFRLTPPDLGTRLPALRKAYFMGLDRTPERLSIDLRPGLMTCQRASPESGRLHVPWLVDGFGTPFIATSTLAERAEPYELAVELARGKLNDLRNQVADWVQLGLKPPPELETLLVQSRREFAKAATSRGEPEQAAAHAQASLGAAFQAGRILIDTYTRQVLQKRQNHTPKLPTLLACALDGQPKLEPWSAPLLECINAARVRCTWAQLEPAEGKFLWENSDAQITWARRNKLTTAAGPLLEFRPGAMPDWLWLWEGDYDAILEMVVNMVRKAVHRYRGKVTYWHVVGRPASGEILGLSEDEQIRMTAKAVQVARQVDPQVQLVVDLDRPWAEWMGTSSYKLGPLHLADSLVRAEIGLTGIGLEVAPNYSAPGSHTRDLLEFSRMLDLYALLNLPLHLTLVHPSSAGPDPNAAKEVQVDASQGAEPHNEDSQRDWAAQWVALAVAKPFVRSVTWGQASDADPHIYPHGGLFRADQTPKPALAWLKPFREKYLT